MIDDNDNFLSLYHAYTSGTECPTIFHRWSAITCLGAYLGRNIHFRQGHFNIHPNLFVMLVGDAGTKKSTSIKMAARLMKLAGYNNFAAKKTRQEKFLLDMAEDSEEETADNILDKNLWGDDIENAPIAETLIAADEFNNFIGQGNVDFMSILGELWDWEGVYDYKLKNSKSVYLNNPTVSLLGGNTPTGMNTCFPPEIIGQGFFSRLILVHADPTDKKYTWMPTPDEDLQARLIAELHNIRNVMQGELRLDSEAKELLEKIYHTWKPLNDIRFSSYANRRFPILLKLVLIMCANSMTMTATKNEVLLANTFLTLAERNMPKSLGEFGKNRHSDITHKVLKFIEGTYVPLTLKDIWKHVYSDLERRETLSDILANLIGADKIQWAEHGYLPVKEEQINIPSNTVDWSLVTKEELGEHENLL